MKDKSYIRIITIQHVYFNTFVFRFQKLDKKWCFLVFFALHIGQFSLMESKNGYRLLPLENL